MHEGNIIETGNAVIQLQDSSYITVGVGVGVGSSSYLVKTDSTGNEIWNNSFRNNSFELKAVQQTSDGGFILGGFLESKESNGM